MTFCKLHYDHATSLHETFYNVNTYRGYRPSDKCNVTGISSGVNYAQKWTVLHYSYEL